MLLTLFVALKTAFRGEIIAQRRAILVRMCLKRTEFRWEADEAEENRRVGLSRALKTTEKASIGVRTVLERFSGVSTVLERFSGVSTVLEQLNCSNSVWRGVRTF